MIDDILFDPYQLVLEKPAQTPGTVKGYNLDGGSGFDVEPGEIVTIIIS